MSDMQDAKRQFGHNSNKGNPNPITRRNVIIGGSTTLAGVAAAGMASSTQAQTGNSTPDHPNVAIIKRYYEAYGRGDLAAVRQIFAPNIVWRIPGHHPLAGPKRGPDEVFAFFEQLARANFKAEVIFLGGNDEYVVDYHRGYGALGDAKLDINWCLVFKMQNGRIIEAINFAGDQHAIEGKAAIHRHYRGLPKAYSRMSFPDLTIYSMLDPDRLLAEYRGEIEIAATGRSYNNRYCALFHLRDGQIALLKEYFNPTILSEAFGEVFSLGATFNLSGS